MISFPQSLFHNRRVANLQFLCRYFPDKSSDEIHLLVSPLLTLIAMTGNATITKTNPLYFIHIPFVRRSKFHSNKFFSRTATFFNKPGRACFCEFYNLNVFKLIAIFLYTRNFHFLVPLIFIS